MTVNSEIKQLSGVSFEEEISSSRLKDLFKAANAAYELVFNTTAPLAASQTYAGHDHTPNGGGCGIFRGGVWSCLGRNGLSTFHVGEASFTNSSQKLPLLGTFGGDETFCYFYPSPGLTPESFYEAYLLLEAYYDYEYVLERSGNEILLITGGGSSPSKVWVKVLLPTTHNFYVGYLETMGIYVRVNSYRPDEQPLLRCYGLIVSEVPNQTPAKGSEVVLNPVSSGCVSTGDFPPLAEDLVEGDEWLDAYVLASLIDFSNTCFEGVFDSKAAGYATQSCKGHDHATNGGRPVARGRVTTSRNGDFLFSVNAATSFVLVDVEEITTRNSEGFGNFRGWVSEGITSGGDEPTSLYLTAEVELTSQGASDTLIFYVANQNSGFISPEFSVGVEISPTLKRITLDQIPCVGGEMNEFDLYVKSETGDPIVTIVSISLFEVAGVGARSPEGSTVSR